MHGRLHVLSTLDGEDGLGQGQPEEVSSYLHEPVLSTLDGLGRGQPEEVSSYLHGRLPVLSTLDWEDGLGRGQPEEVSSYLHGRLHVLSSSMKRQVGRESSDFRALPVVKNGRHKGGFQLFETHL